MKKFLLIVVAFTLSVTICILTINQLYRAKYKEDTIENVPMKIQVCNFGNSHSNNGIDYSTVSEDLVCFNFALAGQSFSYDYRLLSNYKDNIEKGAKVGICISCHSVYGIDETKMEGFDSKNRRYYLCLPKELIKEFDFKTYLLVKYLPSLNAGASLIPTILGIYDSRKDIIERTSMDEAKTVAQARFNNAFCYARDGKGNLQFDTDDIEYIGKMIDLIREIGAEPFLFTTPYLKEYIDVINKNDLELITAFYRLVDEIQEEKKVQYYDWSQDDRFINNYELFTNIDHLNKDGAAVFTKIFMEEAVQR